MKKTLKSASFVTRYFSIFLIAGLVALAGYFLSAKPTSINLITNGSTTQKSTRTFTRPTPDTTTVTTANNSGQARSANENARKDIEPVTPALPQPPNENIFMGANTTIGSGYKGVDGSSNTVAKEVVTSKDVGGGTTVTTQKSSSDPKTGNSFSTFDVVRKDANKVVTVKSSTFTTSINKGDGTSQVTVINTLTDANGKAIVPPTTVTDIVKTQSASGTSRDSGYRDSKTTTSYSGTKKLAGTTGTTGTINIPATELSNAKDEKDCEAKGWRYVDVPADGVNMCVDPDSTECGDRGQSINGVCYYPGDNIPGSNKFVCDWISSANDTGLRYAFNSNNCPEKNAPNPNYVPKTKGDCVGNIGWWDGRKCNAPSSTAKLPGSNMIVCKGVPGKDGQAPIHSYAYVSTIADCPWAQDEIKANCKDIVDPITFNCRQRTPTEKEAYCKSTKQQYDSFNNECVPPGEKVPTQAEREANNDEKKRNEAIQRLSDAREAEAADVPETEIKPCNWVARFFKRCPSDAVEEKNRNESIQRNTETTNEDESSLRPDLNRDHNLDDGLTPSEPGAFKIPTVKEVKEYITEYINGQYLELLEFTGYAPTDVETTEPATNNLQGR